MSVEDPANSPEISVVLVSDYVGGSQRSWEDLGIALEALAGQEFDGTFEVLVVESAQVAGPGEATARLQAKLPRLRLISAATSESYGLKNAGVEEAAAPLVVLLDADCTPSRIWLSRIRAAMQAFPDAVAVSGRTQYAGLSTMERVLAVLSRSYLDPGRVARTRFVSNNNACYRKAAFLKRPLPLKAGPFAARLQSQAILRDGGELIFDPSIQVVHNFGGWAMERDIRRQIGYGTILIRKIDPQMPLAWLLKLDRASIPVFFVGRILESWWNTIRTGRQYGLRLLEFPVAFGTAVVVHTLELRGMIRAFRGERITESAYR